MRVTGEDFDHALSDGAVSDDADCHGFHVVLPCFV